jgi:hypothetical protein
MIHEHTARISDVGHGVGDVLLLGRCVVLGDRFFGRMQCFLMLQQVVRIVTTGL